MEKQIPKNQQPEIYYLGQPIWVIPDGDETDYVMVKIFGDKEYVSSAMSKEGYSEEIGKRLLFSIQRKRAAVLKECGII